MKILNSLQALIDVSPTKVEAVVLDEDFTVYVRSMNTKTGSIVLDNAMQEQTKIEHVVAETWCDEKGNRILQGNDKKRLSDAAKIPLYRSMPIYKAAMKLSGMGDSAEDEAEKKPDSTATD